MSFWQSKSGKPITGKLEDAALPEFSVIPEGTMALAAIHAFEVIENADSSYEDTKKFYQITWKLTQGEFKNRQVTQKLKCFAGKPEAIDRNLNMLKLVMDLCKFKPSHGEAPTSQDLMPMVGMVLGVKIREWSLLKKDGSGMMEGNFVSEVYSSVGFQEEVGTKVEHKMIEPAQSALQRNKVDMDDDFLASDDVPFR